MTIEDSEKTKKVLQEWGAFCDPLLEGIAVYDSGKSLPDRQISDRDLLDGYSKELDRYLRLTFEPPAGGIPPDIFAECPPVLGRVLALRIAHATVLLKGILETRTGSQIQNESDFEEKTHLLFRDLLLPSPPEPGTYYWK
jgi:hypothetical protein